MNQEIEFENELFYFSSPPDYRRKKRQIISAVFLMCIVPTFLLILVTVLSYNDTTEKYNNILGIVPLMILVLMSYLTLWSFYRRLKFSISEIIILETKIEIEVFHFNKVFDRYKLAIKDVQCEREYNGKSLSIFIKFQNKIIAAQSSGDGRWGSKELYRLYKIIKEVKGEKYKKIKLLDN